MENAAEGNYDSTVNLGLKTAADFALLEKQKESLFKAMDSCKVEKDKEYLEGLLNFIDFMQDSCVDINGIPESVVFPSMVKAYPENDLQGQ